MNIAVAIARRDRLIIASALGAVAALAWIYLVRDARQMNLSGACVCMGVQMSAWPISAMIPLFGMWAVMMAAMMLPTASPMILTFAAVAERRRAAGRCYVPVAAFACGYVAIWTLFSAGAAALQWLLHRNALLSPAMASTSSVMAGALLIAAGIFQFTPQKRRCLTRCRTPLDFIMTRWREGVSGAFRMGIEHGAFCTGCCWALMCLLFVMGVMNIVWIAALTLLVGLEKLLPRPAWIPAATGIALTLWGSAAILLAR